VAERQLVAHTHRERDLVAATAMAQGGRHP
jgi:hypothetical protein